MSASTSKPAKPSGLARASTNADVSVPEEQVAIEPINRREFLFYIWFGSMALTGGAATATLIWFLLPQFEEGEFGGVIEVNDPVPATDEQPLDNPVGKFFLSNSETGLVALYKVCTHLGCLYDWVEAETRYECPCHGSKYTRDGTWIEGPAPRSLDRFAMTVYLTGGATLTSDEEGNPIPVEPTQVERVEVDTGARVQRAGRV
jgi:cytochrome b6-f complex iron-sulfur subunit